jgi:acetyl CoA:N6-hydroxylysine acetyl transferase
MGKLHEQGQRLSTRVTTNICRPDGIPYTATIDGNTLLVQKASEAGKSTWRLSPHPDQLLLECITADSGTLSVAELLVAIEACFLTYPQHEQLTLDVSAADINELVYLGLVLRDENKQMIVRAELFLQQPTPWLRQPQPYGFPLTYTLRQGARHPLRPPKPVGVVYERYIPWLGATLSFRTVDLQHDLESFSRWMNDPVVAAAWREEGDLPNIAPICRTSTAIRM